MTKRYDLVIVGTGSAAMGAALRMRAAGWSVAVIDFRPFGGTCALRGCDPKKMLIAGAEAADGVARMHGRGVAGDVRIDWPELIAFKRTFTDPIPQKREHSYAENGVDTFHGHAKFTGRNTMTVDGTALEGRHFLIAAGAEPIKLEIAGTEHLVTHGFPRPRKAAPTHRAGRRWLHRCRVRAHRRARRGAGDHRAARRAHAETL